MCLFFIVSHPFVNPSCVPTFLALQLYVNTNNFLLTVTHTITSNLIKKKIIIFRVFPWHNIYIADTQKTKKKKEKD